MGRRKESRTKAKDAAEAGISARELATFVENMTDLIKKKLAFIPGIKFDAGLVAFLVDKLVKDVNGAFTHGDMACCLDCLVVLDGPPKMITCSTCRRATFCCESTQKILSSTHAAVCMSPEDKAEKIKRILDSTMKVFGNGISEKQADLIVQQAHQGAVAHIENKRLKVVVCARCMTNADYRLIVCERFQEMRYCCADVEIARAETHALECIEYVE